MDPSCLVSMVQVGWGVLMVQGVFSWLALEPLVTNGCLNASTYPGIVADHVPQFMYARTH